MSAEAAMLMTEDESAALNAWCAEWADDNSDQQTAFSRLFVHDSGKRIPYIGWYWRGTDFATGRISIGDCGDFIGVMENNKWGYDGRYLTPDEASELIDLLDLAHAATEAEAPNASDAFKAVWDWFQTLTIPVSPWNA